MLRNRFILAVLAAASCGVTSAYADSPATPDWQVLGSGYYQYSETADGTAISTFKGDCTNAPYDGGNTSQTGYDANGVVGGVRPDDPDRAANATSITVGDGTTSTKLTTVIGSGPKSYAVKGNKEITVKNNAYVGMIVGATEYKYHHTSAYVNNAGAESYYANKQYFAPKADNGAEIKITVEEGGIVGQIRGGSNNSSTVIKEEVNAAKAHYQNYYENAGLSGTELETAVNNALEQYCLNNPPWALNEKIIIKVAGGKVGYADDGTTKYLNNPDEEAIVGAGGKGFAVGNAVEIEVTGTADVLGNIYAGAKVSDNIKGSTGEEIPAYIQSAKITISGGKVSGDVFGGGSYQDKGNMQLQSTVKEGTEIVLSGGQVSGDVYAGGDHDNIGANSEGVATRITIKGEGTEVTGTISGGGKDATVSGERQLSVDSSHDSTDRSIDKGYKLADFTDIDVKGKMTIKSLEAATDGTDLKVGSDGTIKTTAGVLSGLDEVQVDGTLDITVTEDSADKAAVESKKLTFGATAQLNVTNATGDSDAEIKLFDVDESIAGAETLTLTMDGQEVSSDMWDYSSGGIVIKELSAATLALSGNQSSFYSALKAMKAAGAADAMLSDLASSRDSATVKAQLDALSGHELATAMSSQVDGNLGHLRRLRGAMGKGTPLGTTTSVTLCSANNKGEGVGYVAPVTTGQRWRAGVQAYYEESELDADSHGDGYDRSETGAMLTAEYYVKEGLTLGGALSRGRTTLKSDGARKRHEDNTSLDFYALYGKNRWQFASALGFGMHEHDLKRTATSAEADGYSVNFLQDVAYTVLAREKVTVQMFGTIESSWNKMDGFTEKGAYALRVDDQDAWTTDVTVGVRYNHMLPAWGNAPAGVFSAQAGVTGTLGDVDTETEMSLYGVRFSQKSARRDRWGWNIGVGVDVPVRSNVSIYATAETVVRGDSNSVDGQIGVKVAF